MNELDAAGTAKLIPFADCLQKEVLHRNLRAVLRWNLGTVGINLERYGRVRDFMFGFTLKDLGYHSQMN